VTSGDASLAARIHGPPSAPVLVYLPGIHGDWTLVGAFRAALANRVRFVEFTYPRTTTWTLDHYADEVERRLLELGIDAGWVLAESFGSQLAWPLCAGSRRFRARGLILAGGFGRHPFPRLVRGARRIAAATPLSWLRGPLRAYLQIGRWRFRAAPDVARDLEEFVARRTEADRLAGVHRLDLVAACDPADRAARMEVPVHYLTGLFDPVVPWPWVVRWLRRRCARFESWRCVMAADHNVLGSGPGPAASQVLEWMGKGPGAGQ
jgi:pimeloyl-ACP methyl ester carboxylesterase